MAARETPAGSPPRCIQSARAKASHVFPLERISEAFARADWMQRGGDPAGVSRAAISM